MPDSTARATTWSVTINNPKASDDEYIALARQKGWTVDGQPEKGENGTLHYQLIVKTPQVRFSSVKKAFPRAHIEAAKNPVALQRYVHKQDTQVGELTVSQDKYPSLSKLWDLIYDRILQEYEEPDYAPDRYYSLTAFDGYICQLIQAGYHVETMGANPQVRSCFLKYGHSLMIRAHADRQTRQTDPENVAEISIPVSDAFQTSSVSSSPPSDDAS